MSGVMGMMPGMGKMQKQLEESGMDDKVLRRQIAIIQSMTKTERKKPDLLQASRKKRIAAGAGVEVQDVNRLLKMHRQMADMMKKVGKMGKKGLMRGGLGALLGGKGGQPALPPGMGAPGAMPPGPPPGFPGMGGGMGGLPSDLSGFGKKK
jgi:signal recognition particle subunit SRP54